MSTPLLIYTAASVVDVVACNEKSRTKSLEQGELWIVDPRTGRVLPYRDGGAAFLPFREREGWWEVVLSEVEPEGRHTAPTTPTSGATPSSEPRSVAPGDDAAGEMGEVLRALGEVIAERHRAMPEGSYTTHLFAKGGSKIRKKTGEEAVELILAADHDELRSEAADLIYHLMVLLESEGMRFEDVVAELATR